MSTKRRRSGFPAGLREELKAAEEERARRAKQAEAMTEEERRQERDAVVTTAVMNIDMEVPEETHAQAHAHAPRPKENMIRSHFHLRRDQIEFLDRLAKASGPGVHRSHWVRYAIDRLMTEMEDAAEPKSTAGDTPKP